MDKKRGDRRTPIKIIPSSSLLNKKNVIFLLVALLLVILIVYFLIRTWPIMRERLGDEDDDGIKNYQDKCSNTPKGVVIDSYGCETVKESIHIEKPVFIEEDIEEENETIVQCSDSDGGKDIWNKGICKDSKENKDSCKENFGVKLYEYECSNNICDKLDIDCSDYNALCYDGRCIDKNKDTDKDGYPDLDEYGNGTDPENPDDHPGNVTIQSNCNSRCISLGYVSGRGPVGSMGNCNSPEVGQYLSGNSGDVCCCMPKQETNQTPQTIFTKSECGTLATSRGYNEYEIKTGEVYKWTSDQYTISKATCELYADFQCMGSDIKKYEEENNCCMWTCIVGCTDSDAGDDMYTAGYVKDYDKSIGGYNIIADKCYDSTKIGESQCIADQHIFAVHTCPYGCEEVTIANNIKSARCKAYVNPNTGLSCGSTAVTPTSQADCSLRVGCSGATYCEFRYNHCVCSWIQDCVDSDFDEGYRYLEIYKHKGYCKKGSGTQNWDTCVNGKLREWACGSTELCESFDIDCDEWFEGGYCEDEVCKSCLDICPYYIHADYGESRTQSQCIDFANTWCNTNSNSGWKAANAIGKCCCFNCW